MKRIMKSCWSRRHRRGCTRSDWREIRRSSAGKRGSTGKNGRMADHQSSQDSLGASGIGMQDSEVSSSSNAGCACARSRPGISPGKMHSRDCTHVAHRTGETAKTKVRKDRPGTTSAKTPHPALTALSLQQAAYYNRRATKSQASTKNRSGGRDAAAVVEGRDPEEAYSGVFSEHARVTCPPGRAT